MQDGIRDLSMLSDKLEYEIGSLRGKVEDVEDGVEELERLVEGRMPRWMWLKGGVVFVDEIPKSKAGKILRRVIRDKAKAMGETKAKL